MKAKHIAFLSLSVLAGTFASCTDSHEIKITGSVKNLDGGTIIYQINPEKPDVPLNKNDAFQKVQKRHVQEKR